MGRGLRHLLAGALLALTAIHPLPARAAAEGAAVLEGRLVALGGDHLLVQAPGTNRTNLSLYSLADPLAPQRLWTVPVFEPIRGGHIDPGTGTIVLAVEQLAEMGEGVRMVWCDLEVRGLSRGQVLGRAGPLGLGCEVGPLGPGLLAAYPESANPPLTLVDISDPESPSMVPTDSAPVPLLSRLGSGPLAAPPRVALRGGVQALWLAEGTPYLLLRIDEPEALEIILSLADPDHPRPLVATSPGGAEMLEPVAGAYVLHWQGGRVAGHLRLHPDRVERLEAPPAGHLAAPEVPPPPGLSLYGRVARGHVGVLVGDGRVVLAPLGR